MLKKFKGKGMVQIAGRNIGKSLMTHQYHRFWNDIFGPTITILDSTHVDDELWHTVRCQSHVGEWVRKQDPNMWYEHNTDTKFDIIRNKFDMHIKLFLMAQLKFS